VLFCHHISQKSLMISVLFFCLATFYVMLEAPFMAAIQIMVYAGAIMVLIIFVIMLLNLGTVTATKVRHSVSGALLLGALMLFQSIYFLNRSTPTGVDGDAAELVKKVGHTEAIGRELFTNFLLPFEITSILLLVAIVGAVVLAKREV